MKPGDKVIWESFVGDPETGSRMGLIYKSNNIQCSIVPNRNAAYYVFFNGKNIGYYIDLDKARIFAEKALNQVKQVQV